MSEDPHGYCLSSYRHILPPGMLEKAGNHGEHGEKSKTYT
jgi:hypothetical protein